MNPLRWSNAYKALAYSLLLLFASATANSQHKLLKCWKLHLQCCGTNKNWEGEHMLSPSLSFWKDSVKSCKCQGLIKLCFKYFILFQVLLSLLFWIVLKPWLTCPKIFLWSIDFTLYNLKKCCKAFKGLCIYYVCKIFPETNIFDLLVRKCPCAYQG